MDLKQLVSRIESLEEQREELGRAVSDELKAAENAGFDKKALKEVLRYRKLGQAKAESLKDLVLLYFTELEK